MKERSDLEKNIMRFNPGFVGGVDCKTFRERVESSGITQKKIAERFGVSTTTVRKWMNDETPIPLYAMKWIDKIDQEINGKIR